MGSGDSSKQQLIKILVIVMVALPSIVQKGIFDATDIENGVRKAEAAVYRLGTAQAKQGNIANESFRAQRNLNLAIGQGLIGIEDFFTVLGTSGIGGGLRAASNNFSQAARMIAGAGIAGSLAGVGITLASVIIPNMIKWGKEADTVSDALDRIAHRYDRIAEQQKTATTEEINRRKLVRKTKFDDLPDVIEDKRIEIDSTSKEIDTLTKKIESVNDLVNNIDVTSFFNINERSFLGSASKDFGTQIADRLDQLKDRINAFTRDIGSRDQLRAEFDALNEAINRFGSDPSSLRNLENIRISIDRIKQTARDSTEIYSAEDVRIVANNIQKTVDTLTSSDVFPKMVEESQKFSETLEDNKLKLEELNKTREALIQRRIADIRSGSAFEEGTSLIGQENLNALIEKRAQLEQQIFDLKKKGALDEAEHLEMVAEKQDAIINSIIETKKEAKERMKIEEDIFSLQIDGMESHVREAYRITEAYREAKRQAQELREAAMEAASEVERNIKLGQANRIEEAGRGALNRAVLDFIEEQKRDREKAPDFKSSLIEGRQAVLDAQAGAINELVNAINKPEDEANKKREEAKKVLEAIRDLLEHKPLLARKV